MSLSEGSKACVEIPHHVTGFWRPVYTQDLLTTGSLGAGLVITPYTEACYYDVDEPLKVIVNESLSEHITLKSALEFIPHVRGVVKIREPLPFGAGYATSASVTLSALLSLSNKLQKKGAELAQIAHMAEVRERTGLGDVLSLWDGRGLAVRVKPGAPGIGEVVSIEVPSHSAIVSCAIGRMETRDMLHIHKSDLEKFGDEIMRKFLDDVSLENYLNLAKDFSLRMGFLSGELNERVSKLCKDCHGYYLKKKVLVMLIDEQRTVDLIEKLQRERICKLGIFLHYPVNDKTGIMGAWPI